ncbi:helix-turn-helix domain-containing protein [Minwuia thermotolerans]|uniref:Transcriptional regulator n=1 Tax=Minwuia thermotolerans TaxID=2056226 RepID=A0A2M9G2M5_9PROT|nr:helix-turn-helix transcriptional regulator [Minwuia thermotolerans]PJK29958.1 transcriptional regulator [Minwuia thermotolerans]
MSIDAAQCRAARALLNWSRNQLATDAEVAVRTIVDFERGARQPIRSTLSAIRRALEDAGVEFIDGNGSGPGVRLKKG